MSKRAAEGRCIFPACGGLCHGFMRVRPYGIALLSTNGDFSPREKETNPPLLIGLLCACALSLLVLPETLLVEIAVDIISVA